MIDQHFIDILKKADWYYDFCDGLQEYNKAKKSYDTALNVLKHMTDVVQADLIGRYVPEVMHKKVLEDLFRLEK